MTLGQIYQVAWLHYVKRMSQKDIAELFDVDKATVSRWLTKARDQKIVTTTVHPPGIEELEVAMMESFGLRRVRVTTCFL